MATDKRAFTLRMTDGVFDKIETLAREEHRSMTNFIEYVLIRYLDEYENEHGTIQVPERE